MARVQYQLRLLDSESLDTISEAWANIAGAEEFDVELSFRLESYRKLITDPDGVTEGWALYSPTENRTDAIVQIVEGRYGTLSKLLRLEVSPRYWNSANDPTRQTGLINLYAEAFVQVIAKGIGKNGTESVKLYGRNDIMMKILRGLEELWPAEGTGWNASLAGRWLVIRK